MIERFCSDMHPPFKVEDLSFFRVRCSFSCQYGSFFLHLSELYNALFIVSEYDLCLLFVISLLISTLCAITHFLG